jgi:hypothetical protein
MAASRLGYSVDPLNRQMGKNQLAIFYSTGLGKKRNTSEKPVEAFTNTEFSRINESTG